MVGACCGRNTAFYDREELHGLYIYLLLDVCVLCMLQ